MPVWTNQKGSPRGARPSAIYGINYDSSLSLGLQSWIEGNGRNLLQDNGPLGVVSTLTDPVTLRPNPQGGRSIYCTGGGAFTPAASGVMDTGGPITVRLVITPISWPGGFTALADTAGRTAGTSAFLDTSGQVSFAGSWLTGVGIATGGVNLLTAGQRWDVVIRTTTDGANVAGVGFLNGVQTGSFGLGGGTNLRVGADAVAFGNNPSGGGSNADCIYECLQQWNRNLTDEEVWRLYDPQTRWELYWQPSSRVFFLPTIAPTVTTTGRSYFL